MGKEQDESRVPPPSSFQFAGFDLLQGISAHAEELLKHLNYIEDAQSKGLVVFSWGDDNNDHEIRRKLREQGIDGLIYDRLVQIQHPPIHRRL